MHLRLTHPACFGSPIAVSANARSCRACTGSASCLAAADAFLAKQPDTPIIARERLALSVTRQALGRMPLNRDGAGQGCKVVASTRGIKRLPLSPEDQAAIAQLPPRVASATRNLMQRGWFAHARSELQAGRNPGGKGWLKVAGDMLLRGPFTRSQLQLAFQEQLGLSAASAKGQASVSVAVLVAGRLAHEVQHRIMVSPS